MQKALSNACDFYANYQAVAFLHLEIKYKHASEQCHDTKGALYFRGLLHPLHEC